MIIKKIEINNFGIYKDYNVYDFNIDNKKDKNIILVNGKNGSGKTTLLNAIKLSLYGPLFLGYQVYNDNYFSYVESKLNAFALNSNSNDFYVSININILEKGKNIDYKIKRSWYRKIKKLDEKLEIYKENKLLTPKQTSEFMDYLHDFMPLALFEIFFFDGEKIDKLFTSKEGKEHLFNLFDILFNLDLFKLLKLDLNKYIKQKNVYEDLDDHEKEYEFINSKKIKLEKKINKIKEDLYNLNEEIKENKSILKKLEKIFKLNGGIEEYEKNKIKEKINLLSNEKSLLNDRKKLIVNEYLPFLILKKQLSNLKSNIQKQNSINENKIIKDKLNNKKLKQNLEKEYQNINIENILKSIEKYYENPNIQNEIFNLSKEDEFSIYNILDEINQIDNNELLNIIKRNQIINKELSILNKKLENTLEDDLLETLSKIKDLNSKISEKETIVQYEQKELELNEELLKTTKDEENKLFNKLKNSKKDENIYSVVKKIEKIINIYTKETRKEKLELLEHNIIKIFNKLIRKDDFIKNITIDKDTSKVHLHDKLDNQMPEDNLSAGERQIYILSLLWGMLKVSNRKIPLVFDTLLGRLDKSHKSNIVKHFLHSCGEQVVILATDSEIDTHYKELLDPYINKYYVIDFNNNSNNVDIKEFY
ncbi:MAG: DNA sulfur modification protein DndD [Peptostreptococcaceae bacterium]|jgi:DNA sulfur modification protein DndD|nr:DNA sulfur modification protein DndD [Peptostreptococcaceae bacterium]